MQQGELKETHYTGRLAELLWAPSHPHTTLGKPGFVVMWCLEIQRFSAFAVAACTGIWRSEILGADYICPQRSGPFKWMKKGAWHVISLHQFWNGVKLISYPALRIWSENCSPVQQNRLLISIILIYMYAYCAEKGEGSAAEDIWYN